MPQQLINIGKSPNDGTGDSIRSGSNKINANFTELYLYSGVGTTGAARWPRGGNGSRPSAPTSGMYRYNSTNHRIEFYAGLTSPAWKEQLRRGGDSMTGPLEVYTPSQINALKIQGSGTGVACAAGVSAGSNQSNVGLVLQTKGTGALMAQVPDNGVGGGNARGANSVDFQTVRASNTQVASGSGAVILGGSSNTASAADSMVLGGQLNVADGVGSIVFGLRGSARGTLGRLVMGNGQFAAIGDAQMSEVVLVGLTTDATPKILTTNGAAAAATNMLTMPFNSVCTVSGLVTARESAAADAVYWVFRATFKVGANAAATALVGTPTLTKLHNTAGAAAWTLAVAADTTNAAIRITGTGAAAKTIRWSCSLRSVEAG